jgi:hypothetical protein
MTENVKGLSKPQEEGYLSKVANEKARQIITAGGGGEQVIERDEWQHSAFTKNLLEGLESWDADYNKDGCITADELSTYLRENVTEDSDFQQTPQDGRFRNSGGGEFVFFSDATVTNPSSDTDEEDEIVYGCMDSRAKNYDADALINDDSCLYRSAHIMLEVYNEEILDVYMESEEEFSKVEFEITGTSLIEAYGGILEEAGYSQITYKMIYLNFGRWIPAKQKFLLTKLKIENTKRENPICLKSIKVSDNRSHFIQVNGQSCLMYNE